MQKLLLKTRFQYCRNYIKYHFDKITLIEIGLILLIALLLLLRSSSDIGYGVNWLFQSDFSGQWSRLFPILLPIYYLLSEFFAWITFRQSSEGYIIASLPFPGKSITNYYLIRHFNKIFSFFLLISLLFLAGANPLTIRFLHFFSGTGLMGLLTLISFRQVSGRKNAGRKRTQGLLQWLMIELLVLSGLILLIPQFRGLFLNSPLSLMSATLFIWVGVSVFYRMIIKTFVPHVQSRSGFISLHRRGSSRFFARCSKIIFQLMVRDFIVIWRRKRSFLFAPTIAILIYSLIDRKLSLFIKKREKNDSIRKNDFELYV